MHVYENKLITNLDHTICKLESLGTVLTHLATMECQAPDMTALADIGRLIAEHATAALDMLYEGNEITDPFLKLDIEKAVKQKQEHIEQLKPKSLKVRKNSREIGFMRKRKGGVGGEAGGMKIAHPRMKRKRTRSS